MSGTSAVLASRGRKEGFVRLLGGYSAKAVYAAVMVASRIRSKDEQIAELRRLWEMAKMSLPEDAVSFDIANSLGARLHDKGQFQDAKVLWLTALGGRRRVLGDAHK
jgi:uncharacterized Ntn-hydrolase superfamily protein